MEKSLKSELLQLRDLESNIKASKEILRREEERLEKLQEECNHDIVIVSKVVSVGYSLKAKCLFCGKSYNSPHSLRELPNNSLLEVCYCKELSGYSEQEIYEYIGDTAKKIIYHKNDISKEQLREKLKESLNV